MSEKILSLIIPSYNMESYLPKCCDSLLIQDKNLFVQLDIIIVNDGSKDRTSEVAHGYESRFPGVFRVIDKQNGHYGSCVNAALKVATGVFVKILDADDYYDTDAFEEYVAILVALHASGCCPDLVINNTDIVNAANVTRQSFIYHLPSNRLLDKWEWSDETEDLINPSIAFRLTNIKDNGYHQTEGCLYTDNEWVFKGMESVKIAYFVNRSLYKYFIGREGQSASADVTRRLCYQHMEVLDRLLDEYGRCNCEVPSGTRKFLCKYLKRLYAISLQHFVMWPFDKNNTVFYRVDHKFKCYMPEIRTALGRKYVIFGHRIRPFHYISAWQDWRVCRKLPIRLAKWYIAVRITMRKS